jgi:hypothetical protein
MNSEATKREVDTTGPEVKIADHEDETTTTLRARTIVELERALELRRAVEQLEADTTQHAKTISELERMLELERAIERLEIDATQRARTIAGEQSGHDLQQAIERVEADAARRSLAILNLERTLELERALEKLEADATLNQVEDIRTKMPGEPPSLTESASHIEGGSSAGAYRQLSDESSTTSVVESETLSELSPPEPSEFTVEKRSPEMPSSKNAIIISPETPPAWLHPAETMSLDRQALWQNQLIRLAVEMVGDARNLQAQQTRANLFSFLQLMAASIIGVALYVGISGWVQLGRQTNLNAETSVTSLPPTATSVTASKVAGSVSDTALTQVPLRSIAQQTLAFPLPRTYGIYAGSDGQLTELEPLPIKIPDHRVQLSAEIRSASRATVASGRVSFVVFRRALLTSAPQIVSVRVVARVARAMRFVDGKAAYSSIEGMWRIRSKSYQLKVSPLEGHPEMIVIQPAAGFVFPAGRYALVFDGYGYDFTVPGQISAPEQCLEQANMLNGTVLSECSKS